MKGGADDGDIIDYEIFDITPYDDIETLYFKVFMANRKLLLKNLDGVLNGTAVLTPQSGEPSYYQKTLAGRWPDHMGGYGCLGNP